MIILRGLPGGGKSHIAKLIRVSPLPANVHMYGMCTVNREIFLVNIKLICILNFHFTNISSLDSSSVVRPVVLCNLCQLVHRGMVKLGQ